MARLFVDNLTVIDFSYLDNMRGVVGESWIVDIELAGDLDDQGMVFDFGNVKKQIKQFIDAEIDHRLLVPTKSSGCSILSDNNQLAVEFPLKNDGIIRHQSPKDAVLLVDAQLIDSSNIAQELQTKIKLFLPKNVTDVFITLRCEDITGAYYHYTHGLQKHLGQCQRIAHGHRSRIEIKTNGQRNSQLEAKWANRLKDSYIATEAHIGNEFEIDGVAHTIMEYSAQQGDFSITLPSSNIFVMPIESTVENIAIFLANLISENNQLDIEVKAYEGLNKGAFGAANFPSTG